MSYFFYLAILAGSSFFVAYDIEEYRKGNGWKWLGLAIYWCGIVLVCAIQAAESL